MFELSIAWKYLLPKRRQLSVSIISLISVLVISLVVWLILVFFSVTWGLEKGWVDKLIHLTAPIRITPKEQYYNSYYYLIDHYSMDSDYAFRSIGEKRNALKTNPYNEDEDEELPKGFPPQELHEGQPKDLVKLLFHALDKVPDITASDYEVTSANLRLRLIRGDEGKWTQSFLSQPIYLGTSDEKTKKILMPLSQKDHANTLALAKRAHEPLEDSEELEHLNGSLNFPVLAPKSFRDAGVLLGDRGHMTYYAPSASTLQEQRLPLYISGFYDPGIVPLGGKFLLADSSLVRTIRSSQNQDNTPLTNGVNVRFDDLGKVDQIKEKILQELNNQGIAPYWKVETYREYDYAKDLLQQLSSEKNIFSLIAAVIIIVACSNIISMLIILVNDKRSEIGILRSMGATSKSIALIFGACGFIMGLAGTLVGTLLAYFTLKNLNVILAFISELQGYEAFNPLFYGDHLPNTMSYETLLVVLIATGIISLLAGLIPAVKASQMKPAAILRSE